MKVLHISSEAPGNKSGGQLVVKESVYSLSRIAEVDYLGPKIDEFEISPYINKKYYLNCNNDIISKFKGVLNLSLSSYYNSFTKMINEIKITDYDYLYLEFSKWIFIAKYAKKNNKKLIVRLHNIERDYSYNLFILNKSIKNYISYRYYSYIEKKILDISDSIIVLTQKDKKRIESLYGKVAMNKCITIMPVCVEERINSINIKEEENINILVTGSLWYGPNYEGIKWFIDNVWDDIKNNSSLYIVGSKPNKDLLNKVKNDNKIILVENPEDTKEYFEKANIYISPIFSGAGMKVKNAEAMAYGLPIVGTEHSFIGYESSKKLHNICNNAYEFKRAIHSLKNLENESYIKLRSDIQADFKQKYSIKNSYNYLNKIIK